MSFSNMKKNRSSLKDKIKNEIDKQGKNSYTDDDRFWNLTRDKAGNGSATIRFLTTEDGPPIVKVYSHGFSSKGGWYIENCPTTLGDKCPVCNDNSRLWGTDDKEKQDIVTGSGAHKGNGRKRRLTYISNILVVDDPANPENNGRVMLYRFGAKVFEKIEGAQKPKFADKEPLVPHDWFEGANFSIRIYKGNNGFPQYDECHFESSGPVDKDEAVMERLYNSLYDLNEFIDPSKYKDYDTLESRFDSVVYGSTSNKTTNDVDEMESDPVTEVKASTPKSKPISQEPVKEVEDDIVEDDDLGDDPEDFFAKLKG
jgi:hypothetical protein